MQITDMLNQYNRSIAGGTEISGGTQGIKQVVSSLQEMSVGNVFEGSVNRMENGVVTLGLPDGKTIQARLDSGVSVKVGESMFFQVRSNNGSQIAIRPFSSAFGSNPTLLNALEAANLQVNGKTITMVNTMMEQSMSIDKQSLLNMAKIVMGNEGMDTSSIVQMIKLGIPVTEEMAAQFENYKSDQYAILDQLESVMETLPEKLSGGSLSQEKLLEFNGQMMKVFLGEEAAGEDGKVLIKDFEQAQAAETMPQPEAADKTEAAIQKQTADAVIQTKASDVLLEEEVLDAAEGKDGSIKNDFAEDASAKTAQTAEREVSNQVLKSQPDMLKNLLTGSELQQLARQLGQVPEFARNPVLFQDGTLNGEVTSKELLQLLEQAFSTQDADAKNVLAGLLSSKEYRTLIRNVMERQWLVKPEELKSEHKISELYERLDRQMGQMEKILKSFGQSTPQLSDTAANVRSNIQFMNQINQTYAYVQIPLKMAGQNAHSDLYVYTDRRKKQEKDGELTAFLHLDLDHLGSADVSIKLRQTQVATNFYLADDASYHLILENMDILRERLEAKGFQAKIQVKNQEEKVNFVENLLSQGGSSARGMVHRYSFDVRA